MKRTMLLLTLVVLTHAIMATVVTEAQARQLAARHFAGRAAGLIPEATPVAIHLPRSAAGTDCTPAPAFFVFNSTRPDGGFVIIAGDDALDDVLGYSDEGTFDADAMPPDMAWWLACYEEQVDMIRLGTAEPYRAVSFHAPIEPMVRTLWNQSAPYNLLAPEYESGKRSVTGCVATAMAQILRYWAYNQPTTVIPAYTTGSKIYMPELPATSFNYALMQDSYASNATDASAQEVARLMLYCGQAANMNFGASSGATTSASYLAKYFGFSPEYEHLSRHDHTAAEWDEIVYGELEAGRPVILSGRKFNGTGHAFVCDGYDGSGLYHINWGWGGSHNGYFKLSECNPYGSGIGGGSGNDGYSFTQRVLTRMQPGTMAPSQRPLLVSTESIKPAKDTYTRTSTANNFTVTVTAELWNRTGQTLDLSIGVGAYRDGQLEAVSNSFSVQLKEGYGYSALSRNVSFGKNVTSGRYELKVICRTNGGEWQPSFGANVSCVEMEVEGNTLKNVTPEETLKVEEVSFEGRTKVGRLIAMYARITNLGRENINSAYLFVDGELQTGAGVNIDAQATDEVLFHFVPAREGTVALRLCYDDGGQKAFWTGSLEVEASTDPSLTGSLVSVANTNFQRVITGTTLTLSFTVSNLSAETFNDDLRVVLYKMIPGTNTGRSEREEMVEAVIAPLGSKTFTVSFEGLEPGSAYFAYVMVYKPSAGRYDDLFGTAAYTMTSDPTAIGAPVSVTDGGAAAAGGRAQAPVYDLAGRRVGTAASVGSLPPGCYILNGKKFVLK